MRDKYKTFDNQDFDYQYDIIWHPDNHYEYLKDYLMPKYRKNKIVNSSDIKGKKYKQR